jgi:hypothetical protein
VSSRESTIKIQTTMKVRELGMLIYKERYTDDEIDDWDLELRIRMEQLRDKSKCWFAKNWLVNKLVNKYEYFGTFQFDKDWVKDKTFEELQKSIRHYKSILRRKMFGRQDFDMNFFPVIEMVKWSKQLKKFIPVKPHIHILFGEPPNTARITKDIETFFTDCWLEMNESGEPHEHQVKMIYGGDTTKSAESYITKLQHSNVDWFDGKNFTEVKQVFDEDICDWIDRNSISILESFM